MSSDKPNLPPDSTTEKGVDEDVNDTDPASSSANEEIIVAELADAKNQQNSTEKLGRLHPLSLFFDVVSHVRTFIIPAIIALFSAASGNDGGLILAAFIFFPTLIASVIRYFSLRYRIHDAELVVTEGILFRRIRTVPIERIQNIDLIQSVLHRMINVAEVRIETASGTEPEATLRVLSMKKVELLRTAIFHSRHTTHQATEGNLQSVPNDFTNANKTLLSIPPNLLIRAGLASNKGTLLLGVLLGLFFQFDEQIEQYFDLQDFLQWLNHQYDSFTMAFLAAVAILFVFVFFRFLGIAWYLLRFSGYRLSLNREDLRIQCGLLTKVSATIPRKRIQFISIHRNLIMRWMKLASIRIETAGAAGSGVEDAAKSVSSRWFIPVLPESRVSELIEELRPGLLWDETKFEWKPISPLAHRRISRLAIVNSLIIAAIGLAISRPWGWIAGLVAMPLLVWMAIRKAKSRRYARTNEVITYRSGVFNKKTSLTFFEKIQTVSIAESPFDRRWKMATLCVDTAAAGPADHIISIQYLENDFAKREFDEIVKQASGQLPVFN